MALASLPSLLDLYAKKLAHATGHPKPTQLTHSFAHASIARHYKRAAGALLVFDVTSKKSFDNARNVWLRELKNSAESESHLLECLTLVGNKIDLSSTVAVDEAQQEEAAAELGLPMIARTSAKTGAGVDNAFEKLILRVYEVDKSRHGKGSGPPTRGLTLKGPGAQDAQAGGKSDCC